MQANEQGIAALRRGEFAAAAGHFRRAVEDSPDHAGVRVNLANALDKAGQADEAVRRLTEALALDPGLRPAARRLSNLLRRSPSIDAAGLDPAGLLAALGYVDTERGRVAGVALAYLKQTPPLADILATGREAGWAAAADQALSAKAKALTGDPLWHSALAAEPCTDLDIEALLTAVRRGLLLGADADGLLGKARIGFVSALIAQCALNEFIFSVEADERAALDAIRVDGRALAKGTKRARADLCRLALYRPLPDLLEGFGVEPTRLQPAALRALAEAAVAEHSDEVDAARTIAGLEKTDDAVSGRVAAFYEENPYPRWRSLHTPPIGGRRKQMAPFFEDAELAFFDSPFEVLVAGCGTGQAAVECAIGYGENAQVLALDLSLASLAYAKRMAGLFGVAEVGRGIDFMQADLLGLEALERRFRVAESVGVLHHMADPFEGWRALAGRLEAGGILRVGVYSAIARRHITELRAAIEADLLGADADAVRAYRRELIEAGDSGPIGGAAAGLLRSADFHAYSNFRDLLFHVSERPVTIPEMAAFLAESPLRFRGFEVPPDLALRYVDELPMGDAALDLAAWDAFENAHPDAFQGLYVVWCGKPE